MKKRRRTKLERPETIDAILARAGEDRFALKQAPVSLVIWRTAVGPRIADHAIPITLDGDVLVVRVGSSTWASELSMLSDTILARLRQHGIGVKRLVFRTGRIELPQRPVERRATRTVPEPVALPAALRRDVDGVVDDELRDVIATAAARALAFNRAREMTPAAKCGAAARSQLSESPRGARDPRDVEKESAPQDRAESPARGAAPRIRANDRDRSR